MAGEKKFHFAFSGKEVVIIMTMLLFIAGLLFALGLMLGKSGDVGVSSEMAMSDEGDLGDELGDDDLGDDDLGDDDLGENDQDLDLNDEDLDADLDDDLDDDLDADLDDDLDDDLDEETKPAKKAKTKVAKKQAPKAKGKKDLSFYKDLTQTRKSSPKMSSKGRYPMISEAVLLSNRGKYTVQVAAYAKEADAESKTLQLKKTCCSSAYYVVNQVQGKGLWYQVRLGFFLKLSNAKKFARNLKSQGKIAEYVIKVVR